MIGLLQTSSCESEAKCVETLDEITHCFIPLTDWQQLCTCCKQDLNISRCRYYYDPSMMVQLWSVTVSASFICGLLRPTRASFCDSACVHGTCMASPACVLPVIWLFGFLSEYNLWRYPRSQKRMCMVICGHNFNVCQGLPRGSLGRCITRSSVLHRVDKLSSFAC